MEQFQTQEGAGLMAKKEPNNTHSMLNFEVKEGGKNLSLGQKQLICIARALIKKPGILLMDEATANIDEHTDAIIQKLIRNEFEDSTIGMIKDFLI
jgi:ABC-type multidrug transport system fused ATPase/permease subunit